MALPLTHLQETPVSEVKDYWHLLKPRVMSLVVFTGLIGLLVAPGTIHPFIGFIAILCIAISAGAAGALNMWYERVPDGLMVRTAQRPLPQGRVDPDSALAFGMIMAVGSVILMGLAVNYFAGFLLAFTIFFYVVIYTIWLKPRTPQNIVIGGAAGAFPPLIGWVAVTGHSALYPWFLFLLIFLWTPPHFWALALKQKEDYKRAGIPMLPVVAGTIETCRQIFFYTLLLVGCSIVMPIFTPLGMLYSITAVILGSVFIIKAWQLLRDETKCMSLFAYSILYLFLLFLAILGDHYIG